MKKNYKVIVDAKYGYRRLDPIPDKETSESFYKKQYYEKVKKGNGFPEQRRIMDGGEEAEKEREWFKSTIYSDIETILKKFTDKLSVMDVGCGTGELIAYLKTKGFDVTGIEPSLMATNIANPEITIYNMTLAEYLKKETFEKFGIVLLMNILEHTPYPEAILLDTQKLLLPNGVICISVPNDFNILQLQAQKEIKKPQWWVAPPDHVNYFNFESLYAFMEKLGYEVIYSQSSYPMEFFLLQGDDYVYNPTIGNICHQKRRKLELSMPAYIRRQLYQAYANIGIGRDCFVFGRLK
ncbi:MAG: class I SAM-dependent methyltransferase [Dehalococcoidales bacterium]|nr:class I SAM-dependent methyltransferase [Dehalococcoidales bacterium]